MNNKEILLQTEFTLSLSYNELSKLKKEISDEIIQLKNSYTQYKEVERFHDEKFEQKQRSILIFISGFVFTSFFLFFTYLLNKQNFPMSFDFGSIFIVGMCFLIALLGTFLCVLFYYMLANVINPKYTLLQQKQLKNPYFATIKYLDFVENKEVDIENIDFSVLTSLIFQYKNSKFIRLHY